MDSALYKTETSLRCSFPIDISAAVEVHTTRVPYLSVRYVRLVRLVRILILWYGVKPFHMKRFGQNFQTVFSNVYYSFGRLKVHSLPKIFLQIPLYEAKLP